MESRTILIVEDEAAILKLVSMVLERAGFTVLSANSADEAIEIEAGYQKPIDLLLTDIVMSGMVGPDLATKLKERRPGMRVMLMSGYPGGALLVLNYGWHFIQKPFVAKVLLEKVNAMLASPLPDDLTMDHYDSRE